MDNQRPPATGDSPGSREARTTVLLLSGTFFFIFAGAGAQQLYIAPYLQDCTDWSGRMRALIAAAVYVSMMVFRIANVYLLRGWSNWRLTAVGSLTYTLFTLVMLATFWAKSFPLALAAGLVWGWGGAAMWTGAAMQVLAATDAGKRHGVGTGLLFATTHAGWLVGVIVLGLVYRHPHWPPFGLYIVAAGITLIGNIMAWRGPREESFVPQRPTLSDLREIAGRAKVRIAGLLMLTSALSFGLMLGVFGDHIKTRYGAEFIWITASFYPAARLVLSYVGGALADRIGHGFILAGGFWVAAAGLVLAGQWDTVTSAAVTALSLGLLSSAVPVVATAMIGDSADRKRRPLAYGALFCWRDLGVALAAVGGKSLMTATDDIAGAFASFAALFALCGLLALLLQRYARERL